MNAADHASIGTGSYRLRFSPLATPGRACTFPCDARGCVDLDALSPRARHEYFYARTVIGREFAMPRVMLDD